jgi:hypothetical protein
MPQKIFINVPFKMQPGWAQTDGTANFSSGGVILEYGEKTLEAGKTFSPVIKSVIKESRIELADILDVEFKKGVFKRGAKIEIRLKSFGKLAGIPSKDGKITLKINRADYERAREAVADLQKDLRDLQEPRLDGRSPVARLFDESENGTENLNEYKK